MLRRKHVFSTLAIRKINTVLGLAVPAIFIVLAGYIGCNAAAATAFFSLSVAFNALTGNVRMVFIQPESFKHICVYSHPKHMRSVVKLIVFL